MKIYKLLGVALFATLISSGTIGHGVAMPVAKDVGASGNDAIIDVRAGGGARGGGARAGGGGRGGGVARAGGGNRAGVARPGGGNRANVGPPRKNANVNVNKRTNVNVNKRTNVNVNRTNVNVVRRPVRPFVHRPYYGTVIGGIALGTMIAVTAGSVPVAPAPNLCWFWADSAQVNGYWDYCVAP